MKPETFPTRQFANCLANVAADEVMRPVLDGLERDIAKWKADLDRAIGDFDASAPFARALGGR